MRTLVWIWGLIILFGRQPAIAQNEICDERFQADLAKFGESDSLKARLLYFDCITLNDPIAAHEAIQQFMRRKDVQQKPEYLLEAHFKYSVMLMNRSEFDAALLAFDTLYTLAEKNGDYFRMGLAKINQGIAYRRLSQFGNSMEAYDVGLQAARQGKHQNLEASVLMNRGSLLNSMKKHEEALKNLRESYALHQKLKSEAGMAMVAANIGISLKSLGQTDSAIIYYQRAAESMERSGDQYNLAKMNSNIGQLYIALKNDKKANEYLDKAIAMMEAQANINDLVNTLNAKASLQLDYQRWAKAIPYAKRAAELAEQQGYLLGAHNAFEYQAEAFSNLGQFKEAFDAKSKQLQYADSINNDEQQALTAEMQTKFETEKKDIELQQQEERLKLQEAKIRYSYSAAALLGLLLGILSLYFILVNRLNQKLARQQKALEEKNKELSEVNAFKDRLLTIISHDVRNPLAGLKSILGLQAAGAISPEELTEWTTDVTKRIDVASGMLNNLLDWSKTQLVGIKPFKERIHTELFMRELAEQVQYQAALKSITIRWENTTELSLHADRHMLRICMYNLVSNAIKFSNKGEEVIICFKQIPGKVTIAIEDHGVGMTEGQIAQILSGKKFHTTYGTENEKGTGIGLVLTQELLNLMQARLEITSKLGQGSTFSIILPE